MSQIGHFQRFFSSGHSVFTVLQEHQKPGGAFHCLFSPPGFCSASNALCRMRQSQAQSHSHSHSQSQSQAQSHSQAHSQSQSQSQSQAHSHSQSHSHFALGQLRLGKRIGKPARVQVGSIILLLLALIAAVSLGASAPGRMQAAASAVLFLGFLPLLNALADFASTGVTRYYLRRSVGGDTWGWLKDLLWAAVIFVLLVAAIMAVALWVRWPLPSCRRYCRRSCMARLRCSACACNGSRPLRAFIVNGLAAGGAGHDWRGRLAVWALCAAITASVHGTVVSVCFRGRTFRVVGLCSAGHVRNGSRYSLMQLVTHDRVVVWAHTWPSLRIAPTTALSRFCLCLRSPPRSGTSGCALASAPGSPPLRPRTGGAGQLCLRPAVGARRWKGRVDATASAHTTRHKAQNTAVIPAQAGIWPQIAQDSGLRRNDETIASCSVASADRIFTYLLKSMI